MTHTLDVRLGQYSSAGCKPCNQDFHGALLPPEPQRSLKGIAIALADGISSSDVSHIASEAAVTAFLTDYFSTSDAWSVKQSGQRVIMATNAWLHAQTRHSQYRYYQDKGYVCTLSALVLKSATAHLFHVGDARICRLRAGRLECLTEEHRFHVSASESHLARAMGLSPRVEIDYHTLPLMVGDCFVLMTDGVHEFLDDATLIRTLVDGTDDPDGCARTLVDLALAAGSDDNLTVQVVHIDRLPPVQAAELQPLLDDLPLPPLLQPGTVFEGYRILRELHVSSRSHVYLAREAAAEGVSLGDAPGNAGEGTADEGTVTGMSGTAIGTPRNAGTATGLPVSPAAPLLCLKIPASDLHQDPAQLERLLLEEWVARRVHSPHVVSAAPQQRQRRSLYTVLAYVEGQTLRQWMRDHPRPALEKVRDIATQIAAGLRALHRQEILHRDLRPENIMLDDSGTLKLIDFGAVQVAGLAELRPLAPHLRLGTAQYSAPETFLEEPLSPRADQFSLGVIVYELLTGQLPYGSALAGATSRAAQQKLRYLPLRHHQPDLPAWLDEVLKKALHIDPWQRYDSLSEFTHTLRQPPPSLMQSVRPPLMERNPVRFWQGVSLVLLLVIVFMILLDEV